MDSSARFAWLRRSLKNCRSNRAPARCVILILVSGFLLLYGLVPIFGGDQLGLVGADEPRYAQIAREMLAAHSAACHEVNAKVVPAQPPPRPTCATPTTASSEAP